MRRGPLAPRKSRTLLPRRCLSRCGLTRGGLRWRGLPWRTLAGGWLAQRDARHEGHRGHTKRHALEAHFPDGKLHGRSREERAPIHARARPRASLRCVLCLT